MDRETEYNTELTKIHHTNYVRNNRAIVVLWAIFSAIFLALNIIVFIQPQWIGDSSDSYLTGYFGLWRYCRWSFDEYRCFGDFLEWDSMLNDYFKASSVMVGVSCLLFIVCVFCFLLFCLLNTATVLRICGWFQVLSACLMGISVIVYAGGFDHAMVRDVCGLQADRYDIGTCEMRWAYILAIVLFFDALILSILAFVLAAKQGNLLPEVYKNEKDTTQLYGRRARRPVSQSSEVFYSDPYSTEFTMGHPKSRGLYNDSYMMD